MTKVDERFKKNIQLILDEGALDKNPRAKYQSDGEPAHTIFITDVYEKYEINELPLTTLRRIPIKAAIKEIKWIYQQQSNKLKDLHEMNVNYWDDWDIGDGTIGKRYGDTIKRYDLMNKLLEGLEKDPYGRRHIISLWQENDFDSDKKGLKPCAFLTEWSIIERKDGNTYVDLHLVQRSNDYLVSGSINEVQYKALQMMVAKHLGVLPGTFSRHVMNLHIYDRHVAQASELLSRAGSNETPELLLNVPSGTNFYDIQPEDFELVNYHPDKKQLKFDLGV